MQIIESEKGTILTLCRGELGSIAKAVREMGQGVGDWNPELMRVLDVEFTDWFEYLRLREKFGQPAYEAKAQQVKATFQR
jgi:hypothetical protein